MWLPAWVWTPLVHEQILDAERDAFERAALALGQLRVGGLGHVARLLGRHDDIGVEQRIGALDRREIGVGQLGGGDLLRRAACARAAAIVSSVRSLIRRASFRRTPTSSESG